MSDSTPTNTSLPDTHVDVQIIPSLLFIVLLFGIGLLAGYLTPFMLLVSGLFAVAYTPRVVLGSWDWLTSGIHLPLGMVLGITGVILLVAGRAVATLLAIE